MSKDNKMGVKKYAKKDTKKELVGKMRMKKDVPYFNVVNYGFIKRVKDRWRKPRGVGNKKRVRVRAFGPVPKIGYKNPDYVRGMHPSGHFEVLVRNISDVDSLKASKGTGTIAIRIASSVGWVKRAKIVKKAEGYGFKILNPGLDVKEKLPTPSDNKLKKG